MPQKDRVLLLSLNLDLPGNPKRKNRATSKMWWSARRVLFWVCFMPLIRRRRNFLLEITLEKKAWKESLKTWQETLQVKVLEKLGKQDSVDYESCSYVLVIFEVFFRVILGRLPWWFGEGIAVTIQCGFFKPPEFFKWHSLLHECSLKSSFPVASEKELFLWFIILDFYT